MTFDDIPSAWRGHEQFAEWLVKTVKPQVIVDLGVDYGFSTIAFARPQIGRVYAIDHFQGDAQTGARNVLAECRKNIDDAHLRIQPSVIVSDFDAAARAWFETMQFCEGPIDILHIDGAHDYASVKHDFDTWKGLVRMGGVILLHDTRSFPNDVGRFFSELRWPKFEFGHSGGLGVVYRP